MTATRLSSVICEPAQVYNMVGVYDEAGWDFYRAIELTNDINIITIFIYLHRAFLQV